MFNMKKEELEKIVNEQSNLKNLPNSELTNFLDLLNSDFELTKENIIKSTLYLDKIEELYNNVLKVYQDRNGRR
jgi:flagellar motor switch protein FliG